MSVWEVMVITVFVPIKTIGNQTLILFFPNGYNKAVPRNVSVRVVI